MLSSMNRSLVSLAWHAFETRAISALGQPTDSAYPKLIH
jgi:hypothetical protein